MEEAAENLEFERAARIRDRLAAIKRMGDRQKVVALKVPEQDIIALAQGPERNCFEVFRFMNGRLCDRETYLMGEIGEPEAARSEFMERYYSMRDRVPPRVSLDGPASDMELLSEWLSQKAGRKVQVYVPQKGEQAQLVEMCRNNAAEHLLGMAHPPAYIEAYDISNLAGGDNVAGMVVFENGRPLKSAYRKFKIKTVVGQDDYGSMREVIGRRLQEYFANKDSGEGFGRLPDLILLDGGKGHVAAVKPILEASGLDIALFGMVKDDKHRTRAIAEDGGEIAINSNRKAFTLVSSIQEEVHRFAIGYHRQTRKKNTLTTTLTEIEGIGETRARALLRHFRTLTAIRQADLAELETAPGMTKPAAKKVYEYFHGEEPSDTP